MNKSNVKLLLSILIISIVIIFQDLFVLSILYSFMISLILLFVAIAIYTLSLITIFLDWRRNRIIPKRFDLILHVVFLLLLSGYLISKTEIVKSKPILIADTLDNKKNKRLILRKNGDCQFQQLTGEKNLIWEYSGTYKIIGDTIDLTIIPYKMILNDNTIWYLDLNSIDYNKKDTVFMAIIPVDFL